MPCNDNYNEEDRLNSARTSIRAELEPLLCEACDLLEKSGLLERASKKLRSWAKKHEKNELERVKQEALAKLSPKEKRALGLK